MTIEGAIVARLIAFPAVVTALGDPGTPMDRIWPERGDQEAEYPFVEYIINSDEQDPTQEGVSGWRSATFQFSAWATTPDDSKALGRAISKALTDYTADASGAHGVKIERAMCSGPVSAGVDQARTPPVFHSVVTCDLNYTE